MSINDIIAIRSSLLRDTKLYKAVVIDNNTNHIKPHHIILLKVEDHCMCVYELCCSCQLNKLTMHS